MKKPITLGVVCLARTTYDYMAATELYATIRKDLAQLENVTWEIVEELVISQ